MKMEDTALNNVIPGNLCRVDFFTDHGTLIAKSVSHGCDVDIPNWMAMNGGSGLMITSTQGHVSLVLEKKEKGRLRVLFRGPDVKFLNGQRKRIWVRYTSIKVNGDSLLKQPVYASHDSPYRYSVSLDDDARMSVSFDWDLSTVLKSNNDFGGDPDRAHHRLLEQRIICLEQELACLSENVRLSEADRITKKWRSDIWGLKELINSLPQKNRALHIRVYESLLKEAGSWIGYNAMFKSKPIFPHGFLGIFISGGARIGRNVVIFQHVTIGSNTLADSPMAGSPVVGDNCYIGAGAKIIGRVRIGNNVRIGANCVVCTDVPDNSLVVMSKPRIISRLNMDNKFYNIVNGVYGCHVDGKFIPVKRLTK